MQFLNELRAFQPAYIFFFIILSRDKKLCRKGLKSQSVHVMVVPTQLFYKLENPLYPE